MKQEQNQNATQGKENTTRWVFIPVAKTDVLKREETYVLLKVGTNYSAIVSSKFVRAKESDTHIYLSIPEDYKVKLRETMFDATCNKYIKVGEQEVDAWYLRKCISKLQDVKVDTNLEGLDLPDDDLPF